MTKGMKKFNPPRGGAGSGGGHRIPVPVSGAGMNGSHGSRNAPRLPEVQVAELGSA